MANPHRLNVLQKADILTLPTTFCHFLLLLSHLVKKQVQNTTGEAATRYFTFFWLGNCFKHWLDQTTTGKPRYFESPVHGQTSPWQTPTLKTSNCSISKWIQDVFRSVANECLSTTSEFYWQQRCRSSVNITQGITVVITTLIIMLMDFSVETPLFEPADGVK